jgi:uncharacterized protein (DUF3084 family)
MLQTQVTKLNQSENQQSEIKSELHSLYEDAIQDLEECLKQAKAERGELNQTLEELRQKVMDVRAQNEFNIGNNIHADFSNTRIASYTKQLRTNLENLSTNYNEQLSNYVTLINNNSNELERLRSEYSLSTKNLYDISVKNHSLYMQMASAKHERDLHVTLDEQHKIEMLIVDTQDSHRRA